MKMQFWHPLDCDWRGKNEKKLRLSYIDINTLMMSTLQETMPIVEETRIHLFITEHKMFLRQSKARRKNIFFIGIIGSMDLLQSL